jgi:hypothetical protein
LLARRVQTHLRKAFVIRTGRDLQDILHEPDELRIGVRGKTPAFF